jgi:6-pyruvoyltetrahydropterin/6-carboxytetrahydropterin synthase
MYLSTKEYGHNVGLSCAFRQWKAHSHCRLIHGYALAIKFVFAASELEGGWVVDFGGMKSLKAMLEDTFDHTLLVAEDDPELATFQQLDKLGVARIVVVPATGCEAFANMIFECAEIWMKDNGFSPRCKLISVEVKEHSGNSALRLTNEAPI